MKKGECCSEWTKSDSFSQDTEEVDAAPRKKMRKTKGLALCLIVGAIVLLVACAPRVGVDSPPAESTNGESAGDGSPSSTALAWWSPDSDCATCHENSATTLASLKCEAAHTDNPSEACMTCHDDAEKLGSAHESVDMSDTAGDTNHLKVSAIQENTCLTCHNRDDLIAATAEVKDLTDFKGLTVNPHEASTVHNVNGAHDNITCGSCHKMHSTEEVSVAKVAYDFCAECHHTGVYECNTCH